MKRNIIAAATTLLLLFVAALNPSVASAAVTAEQVAQKAAAVVNNSKGITATFNLSAAGHNTSGTFRSSGKKYSVILPEVGSWYNGKDLYTYNPRTEETTVITPTAQELLESNPLLYVKGGAGNFTYSFSKTKMAGKYVVDLLPRNNKSGLKKLTFVVNASTFHPEKVTVVTDGGTSVLSVTSLKTDVESPASAFEYPKNQYPKAEVIDLR